MKKALLLSSTSPFSQCACNGYSYTPFTAKPEAACELRLGCAATSSKYDVIHKTGSTQHITTPPEEDRATATCNKHKNLGKDRICSSEDMGPMIADRQTWRERQTDRQTDRHAHHNTPLRYRGRSNKSKSRSSSR